jgi:hypothetical protein
LAKVEEKDKKNYRGEFSRRQGLSYGVLSDATDQTYSHLPDLVVTDQSLSTS